ncbi:MAG TPA: DsrE family protein [Longimicrobiales bacterium]|nr:DsrE family protein [Longimicrobiales bacterium]
MPGIVHLKGGNIGVCGTCMDARGLRGEDLVAGASHSPMEELADWTLWADKVLVF